MSPEGGTWAWMVHAGDEILPPCAHLVLIVSETINALRGDLYELKAYTRGKRWHTACTTGPATSRSIFPVLAVPRLSAFKHRRPYRVCQKCLRAWLRDVAPEVLQLDTSPDDRPAERTPNDRT